VGIRGGRGWFFINTAARHSTESARGRNEWRMGGRNLARAAALLWASGAAAAAAAADQAPICPDRPSKATGTCTVPAGHWQVETGLVDWTRDRSDGVRSDLMLIGSSLIKYGLSDRADLELGITPLMLMRTRGGGGHERHSGFGDMLVRAKYRLTADDAPIAIALDPFVKLPTASRHLGNRKVEAGIVAAVSAPLGRSPLTLSMAPEADWRADADGHGHHAAMIQLVNLGLAASSRLSLGAELWGQWDWDPSGTGRQASADGSIAYLVSNSVQIDGGANFGLNRETPDVELYAGVSKRF
jgi:hypothetical protein